MVPRAVVPHVGLEQSLHIPSLALPDLLLDPFPFRSFRKECAQDPLTVRPRVVVLGVECEGAGREGELAGGVAKGEDYRPAVLPDMLSA